MQRSRGGSTQTVRPPRPEGCGCKPDADNACCATGSCGCRKKRGRCGPGCKCHGSSACGNDGKEAPAGKLGKPGRGRKRKLCELGSACPYLHEHQHQGEYHHGEDDVPAPRPAPRPFASQGRVLGGGGGSGGSGGGGMFASLPTGVAPRPAASRRADVQTIDLTAGHAQGESNRGGTVAAPPPGVAPRPAASRAGAQAIDLTSDVTPEVTCTSCGKLVPAPNYQLHLARCR